MKGFIRDISRFCGIFSYSQDYNLYPSRGNVISTQVYNFYNFKWVVCPGYILFWKNFQEYMGHRTSSILYKKEYVIYICLWKIYCRLESRILMKVIQQILCCECLHCLCCRFPLLLILS